jgi:hypothetical protein
MLLNLTTHRSPACAHFPCCVAQFYRCCCIPDIEYFDLDNADATLKRMLTGTAHPNCPEEFKGVFWCGA